MCYGNRQAQIMQPFTVQTLAVSFLGLQLLLCNVHTCAAHSHGIKQKVCQTGLLHVSHSGARSVNESVTVLLHKTDRTQVTCVEPSQEYTGTNISYSSDACMHSCMQLMAFHSSAAQFHKEVRANSLFKQLSLCMYQSPMIHKPMAYLLSRTRAHVSVFYR